MACLFATDGSRMVQDRIIASEQRKKRCRNDRGIHSGQSEESTQRCFLSSRSGTNLACGAHCRCVRTILIRSLGVDSTDHGGSAVILRHHSNRLSLLLSCRPSALFRARCGNLLTANHDETLLARMAMFGFLFVDFIP